MADKPFEFEQALHELEEITLWFEGTDVDLDVGLVKYERGMELAHQLKGHLSSVENRVEKIKAKFQAQAGPIAVDEPLPGANDDTDSQAGLFQD